MLHGGQSIEGLVELAHAASAAERAPSATRDDAARLRRLGHIEEAYAILGLLEW